MPVYRQMASLCGFRQMLVGLAHCVCFDCRRCQPVDRRQNVPPGVNDGDERAHALGKLLQGRDMHLNLIPW
jgi:hypothetical protein